MVADTWNDVKTITSEGGPREKLKGISNDKQDVMKAEDPGPSHNDGGIQGISVF